jgi:hypothetical protein
MRGLVAVVALCGALLAGCTGHDAATHSPSRPFPAPSTPLTPASGSGLQTEGSGCGESSIVAVTVQGAVPLLSCAGNEGFLPPVVAMAVGEKVTISGLQGPFAAIRPSGLVQQQGHTFLALQVGVVTLTNRSEFCYSYIPKVVHHPICPLLQIDIVASANDIEGASVMPNLLGMAYTQASSNLQDRFGQQLHVHVVRVHTPTRYPVGTSWPSHRPPTRRSRQPPRS